MKKSALLWAALSPFLLGCAATRDLLAGEEEKQERAKIEYSASEQPRELDLPPDLINSFESEFDGPVNYSQYRLGDIDAGPRVAASPDDDADIRYLRAGGLRWLVVARPPEQVWPLARAFLLDFGFALEIDSAELGVLETDWLENRARARAGGFTGIIDKALDRFWDTGERDKFRLRIEPGERAQTTEVYLSHRGIASRFARRTDLFEGFERLPPNPQLEVEMLRRLMIRLSGQEPAQIDAIVSAGENAADPRPPDFVGRAARDRRHGAAAIFGGARSRRLHDRAANGRAVRGGGSRLYPLRRRGRSRIRKRQSVRENRGAVFERGQNAAAVAVALVADGGRLARERRGRKRARARRRNGAADFANHRRQLAVSVASSRG